MVFSDSVAKDRAWFGEDYVPFESALTDWFGHRVQVVGVGTVNLLTKRVPRKTGQDAHGTLRLLNVVHAPDACCNIIGGPIVELYDVMSGPDDGMSKGTIKERDGRPIAYFRSDRRLFNVRLSGPPIGPRVGPTVLTGDRAFVINAIWPNSERQRFEAKTAGPLVSATAAPPYLLTPDEKEWLKKHFKNEFNFLRMYGLSIFKGEDREEGRAILRAMIEAEDNNE